MEYLSAFEKSDGFKKIVEEKLKELKTNNPQIQYSDQDVHFGIREHGLKQDENIYNEGLQMFYGNGNLLPKGLENYSPETQDKIKKYWQYIAEIGPANPRKADKNFNEFADVEKYNRARKKNERAREELHGEAALSLLGTEVVLDDGTKIDMSADNDNALSLKQYKKIGRAVVLILSEENNVCDIDVYREKRK